jgi:hypothetical protein
MYIYDSDSALCKKKKMIKHFRVLHLCSTFPHTRAALKSAAISDLLTIGQSEYYVAFRIRYLLHIANPNWLSWAVRFRLRKARLATPS